MRREKLYCWPVIIVGFLRLKGLDNEWSYTVHLTGCLISIRSDQALSIILDIQDFQVLALSVVSKWKYLSQGKFQRGAKYVTEFFTVNI